MDAAESRRLMVDRLVSNRYVTDKRVAQAMMRVERHQFLPERMAGAAYIDSPLSIGQGQTISAPHMVGIMAEALHLAPGMKVLEVGGGSGYHAAVIAELVRPGGRVLSVERLAGLAEQAKENLGRAGYGDMVTIVVADGYKGWAAEAPYDRISVACGAPKVPEPLLEQLKEGGKILIPVGGRVYQELLRCTKKEGNLITEDLGSVLFVPLIGEYGFPE